MEVTVVSIGALSRNPLWGEKNPVRTSHATTTLVRHDKTVLLVDPSLPPQILEAKLFERSGLKPSAVTHIFLTNWRPVHRRALAAFPNAQWWMHSDEIDAAATVLGDAASRAQRDEEDGSAAATDVDDLVRSEKTLLKKIEPAPDQLFEGVDLFPLSGYTPGQCGLLVATAALTTIISGDAVPTAAHFSAGHIFPDSWDLQKAKDSLVELYEVADLIIPGHDNIFLVPRAAGM